MRHRLRLDRKWLSTAVTRFPYAIIAVVALATVTVGAKAAFSGVPEMVASKIGGPFRLIDHNGRVVTDLEFRGKWLLVYFGYTHCPDSCPTALSDMAAALADLDPVRRDKVRALFISVDPERDTPATMKDYVEAFDNANIIGLTGTNEEVSTVEAAYRIRAQRFARKDGDYSMSHNSAIHIMDPAGHFVTLARPEHIAESLAGIVP